MCKVSIIVPVYNTEKYLAKCLESLIGQTLDNYEIIIINDGSTDSSQEIIDRYKNQYSNKIKAFKKNNEGQAIARNWALELCRGDYVGFVDSDDYVSSDMYEKMYTMAIDCNADLVMCDYFNINGNVAKEIFVKQIEHKRDLLIDPKVAPWNKIYKASVVKNSGVRFHEKLIYEDTAFYVDLVPYITKCINVHEPLVYHVQRTGSTTSIVKAERFCQMFPIMNGILDFYKINGYFEEYYPELEYFYSKMLLGSSFRRLSQIDNKIERNKYLIQSIFEVEKNFPNFRRNKYFHNTKLGIYMYFMRKFTVGFMGNLLRIRSKRTE